jgi:hypothetical protein
VDGAVEVGRGVTLDGPEEGVEVGLLGKERRMLGKHGARHGGVGDGELMEER